MIRGLYTAASGMMLRQAEIDLISNNIANAATPGYRRDLPLETSFPQMLLQRLEGDRGETVGAMATGAAVSGEGISFVEGALQNTGDPFNLALQGNAFFVVGNEWGEVFATRNGSFALDAGRKLVDSQGNAVLGEVNGRLTEIYVPDGQLQVAEDGSLRGAVDARGEAVTRLCLRGQPAAADWVKVGDSLFTGNLQNPAQGYRVIQGGVEGSNVSPVEEMVRLISALRAYETNAKVIQTVDSTLDKLISTAGSIG